MKRIKVFVLYGIGMLAFLIFSHVIINVSLESSYQKLGRKDALSQVSIYQAEATAVNGRIKGKITNKEENPLDAKYLRFDLYSPRDVLMGTKYIDISDLDVNEEKDIEMYFKLDNVDYYQVSETDEKTENEIELLPHDLSRREIVVATLLTVLLLG